MISVFFTIKLVIPVQIAFLETPKRYYEDYRLTYEQAIQDQAQIENLLKASYINLPKIDTMSTTRNITKNSSIKNTSSTSTSSTTNLPGVNNSQVIMSSPKLVKENSQFSSAKKD